MSLPQKKLIITLAVIITPLVIYLLFPKLSRYIKDPEQQSNRQIFLTKFLDPFYNFQIQFKSKKFPQYHIQVSAKNLEKILSKLPPADSSQMLTIANKPEVAAIFIADNKQYQITLSVRGEQGPHWRDAKKSWRVKFINQI